MKRKWVCLLLVCMALALIPASAGAVETRNIFADMTTALSSSMEAWLVTAAETNARDLDITLEADCETLEANETARLNVTLTNPRLRACEVSFALTFSQSDRLNIGGGDTQREIVLPAARIEADGSITPGRVELSYTAAMLPTASADEGVIFTTVAATMREGSRWYQSAKDITLCSPHISAVLRATSRTLAPQEAFYYEISLTNSGGASGTAQIVITLPEGISYEPQEAAEVTRSEAEEEERAEMEVTKAQAVSALQAADEEPLVRGRTLTYTANVPAARYDENGTLVCAANTVLRVPVKVEATVLEDTPSAVRTLSCGVTLDGERLQEERITVRGPIIRCTLTPSLRDVEMGGTLSYTCEVTNSGYAPADVRVTFSVPEGLRFTRFITRGLQNKVAGDMLSWVVHLDAAEFDLAGDAIPTKVTLTYQMRADELEDGVRALLVPATAVYQTGEEGKAYATDVALTTVHRPTIMGLTGEEWFLLCWAGIVLILTVLVLFVLIRRDADKVR